MILDYRNLEIFAESIKKNHILICGNGVFDIIHRGHIEYLRKAKSFGGILLVGITGDAGVRKLKGKNRPINSENDRTFIVDSLDYVDFTCIFPEKSALNLLKKVVPNIYIKGGNYDINSINSDER